MALIDRITAYADELTKIRRDIHAHPEIGFEEVRTSGIVAEKLASWGVEVHRNIGKTGIVGVLKGTKGEGRRVGLRADMDALPIDEKADVPYRSTVPGRMHACGHDSHTTMLLGAARYLAETRQFAGTAVFIFQPAEEGLGGARAMLAEKLFDRFPCDEIYGMHNSPYNSMGEISISPGASMAGADLFDLRITGRGSHGAAPQMSRDPIVVATALVQALQTVISRNTDPLATAVLSVTKLHAGSAYNVIPNEAVIGGTVRMFSAETRDMIRQRMRELCAGTAAAYGVEIEVDIREVFRVLENDAKLCEVVADIAREVVGPDKVSLKPNIRMASEDFADMLHAVPGVQFTVGHGTGVPLHNPGFVLDDAVLPVGASMFARIVERRLAG